MIKMQSNLRVGTHVRCCASVNMALYAHLCMSDHLFCNFCNTSRGLTFFIKIGISIYFRSYKFGFRVPAMSFYQTKCSERFILFIK